MSDTPRTDAACGNYDGPLLVDHARTLERELAEAQEEVARLKLALEDEMTEAELVAENARLQCEVDAHHAALRTLWNEQVSLIVKYHGSEFLSAKTLAELRRSQESTRREEMRLGR